MHVWFLFHRKLKKTSECMASTLAECPIIAAHIGSFLNDEALSNPGFLLVLFLVLVSLLLKNLVAEIYPLSEHEVGETKNYFLQWCIDQDIPCPILHYVKSYRIFTGAHRGCAKWV